ncbi:WD40 repeat domain-containing protein, partial [Streptomyces sp. NPDC057575]
VRVWDLATGEQVGEPLTGHTDRVSAVATAIVDGRAVAVTSGEDNTARVWDLLTGRQVGQPMTGENRETFRAMATVVIDGRPHAVTGDTHGTVRVWDLVTRRQVGQPMSGHNGIEVAAVAALEVDGHTVIVSVGGFEVFGRQVVVGGVRVWDPAATQPADGRLAGHGADVWAAATATADGRPVVLTGGRDRVVQARDVDTGHPIGQSLAAGAEVRAIATATAAGHLHAVVGDGVGRARVWDLTTGRGMDGPQGHVCWVCSVATAVVDGRPVAVTGGGEEAVVSVWDLAKDELVGWLPSSGGEGLALVATATVNGRPCAVTGIGTKVQLWDLATLQQVGATLAGHTREVWAVATAVIGGRPYAATGDGETALVWDLTAMEQVGMPINHRRGWISLLLTEVDGRPHVVTGGSQCGKVQIWDPVSGGQAGREWQFPAPVDALAITQDSRLIVGFGRDVAALSPPLTTPT